ncbi:MAG: DUF1697 domain-containing protein [Acidimicrobiia bacterium]|nr:DUF1697 domain-containing protein [Acidimicrobiia bacterium]
MQDAGIGHRQVAFLRGMNLGERRLTNEELAAAFASCGYAHVDLYQASGNAIIDDTRTEDAVLDVLEHGLAAALGYPVPVFVRTAADVRRLAAATPFSAAEQAASDGKPQVIFLRHTPSSTQLAEIEALVPVADHLVADGRHLHWLPATGLADTDLDLRRLDALTGGTTIRTHGTVARLAAKFL